MANNSSIKEEKHARTEPFEFVEEEEFVGGIFAHGTTIPNRFIMIPEGIHLRPLTAVGTRLRVNQKTFSKETMAMLADVKSRRNLYNSTQNLAKEVRGHFYHPGDLIYDMQLTFSVFLPNRKASGEEYIIRNENGDIQVMFFATGIVTDGNIVPSITTVDIPIDRAMHQLPGESDGNYARRIALPAIMERSMEGHDESIIQKGALWDRRVTLGSILRLLKQRNKEGHYFLIACRGTNEIDNLYADLKCIKPSSRKSINTRPHELNATTLQPVSLKRTISLIDEFKNFNTLLNDIIKYSNELKYPSDSVMDCRSRIRRIRNNYEVSKEDFCILYEYGLFIKQNRDDVNILCDDLRIICSVDDTLFLGNPIDMMNWKKYACMLTIFKFIKASKYNISDDIQRCIDHLSDTILVEVLTNSYNEAYVYINIISRKGENSRIMLTDTEYDKLVDQYIIEYQTLTEKILPINLPTQIFNKIICGLQYGGSQQNGGARYNEYHTIYKQTKHAYVLLNQNNSNV